MASVIKTKAEASAEDLEALFGAQTTEWGGSVKRYPARQSESDMSMSASIGGEAEYSGFDGEPADDGLGGFDSVPPQPAHLGTYAISSAGRVTAPGFNRVPRQPCTQPKTRHGSDSGSMNMNWDGDDGDTDDFADLDEIPGVSNPDGYVSVKPAAMRQTGARYNASASVMPSVSVRRNGLVEAAGSEGFTAFANALVTMMTAFFVSVMPVILIDTVAQPIAIMLMVHPLNLIWLPYAVCMTLVGFRLSSLIFGTPIWDDLTTDRREAAKRFKKETEMKAREIGME